MKLAAGGGNDLSNLPDLFVPYELVRHQPQDAPILKSFVAASGHAEDAVGYCR